MRRLIQILCVLRKACKFIGLKVTSFIVILLLCLQTSGALAKDYAFLTYPSFWKWDNETDVKNQITKLLDLSESGANFNTQRNGWPILFWAIRFGHPRSIQTLLSLGVNYQHLTNTNENALHYSAMYSTRNVLKDLADAGLKLSDKDSNGDIPIAWAARAGKLDNLKFLYEYGSSIRFKNLYGHSIMHAAALGNNRSIIQLLHGEGISLDAVDKYGQTPLHLAARSSRRNFEGVKILIKLGANPNIQDINGATPLHLAHHFMGNCPTANQLMSLFFQGRANKTILDINGHKYDEVGFELGHCHEWNY